MRKLAAVSLFLVLAFSGVLASASYALSDAVVGWDFYGFFNWETMADPTHGRVNYVDQATAQNRNLSYAGDDTFILRADYTTVLDPSGPGRDSVRIQSWNSYTQHVVVFDIRHMPQGCGTWPAVWEVVGGDFWPEGGELDIIEGINDRTPNSAVLHASQDCTVPASRAQQGQSVSTNCASSSQSNQGCIVRFPTANSFGPAFNANGGGWYAMERSEHYIKIWFWARDDPSVPSDVSNGGTVIDPDSWGTATAYYPDTSCDFPSHFWDHVIVINLTFCGDWAGVGYSQSGCPSTCLDIVNNHPEAFADAYFEFAGIRVYQ